MGRSAWSPPPMPREHGAWVMLLLPVALGAGLAGAGLSAAWLVPPAVVLVFLAHHAVVPVVQRRLAGKWTPGEKSWPRVGWAALYLLGALALFACTLALTPAPHRSWLIAVSIPATLGAALYTGASMVGEHRRVWIELAGMASMSLSAPMMGIASVGEIGVRLPAAAAMAFAYSASTLAFVRAYRFMGERPVVAAGGCVAAHVLLLGALALMAAYGWLSPWWFLAFVPVVARTVWGLASPPRNLRDVGMREIWVALSFTAIAVVIIGN